MYDVAKVYLEDPFPKRRRLGNGKEDIFDLPKAEGLKVFTLAGSSSEKSNIL
ncbi:hypothetical protein M413DRAFT_440361 [Hebeloma cylindrosporum]|uniref:Uncharacterized protein n=1 Tax=Hebeloma cylindrosporum TaxID=76867 RepID=A0A0C2YAC9_HEBCY|nr:hypothetical protein M413DRAFT_440361 [Hebeloma cylindrosporum h7]